MLTSILRADITKWQRFREVAESARALGSAYEQRDAEQQLSQKQQQE